MKTAHIIDHRQCGLTERPEPLVRGRYALLKVHVAPMCNEYLAYRDLCYLERNRPDSLGHEMAGEVVVAPEGSRFRAGDRVVALCGYPCGKCEPCERGYYAHCAEPDDPRAVCGSESGECGFAQYAIKPDWMLLPIPAGMSYEHAAMACCGLGPTFGAMQRLGVTALDTVLVTGLGAVGLGGVVNARFRGARVIAAVRTPYRAELARKLGCDVVVNPEAGDVRAQVRDATDGKGADVVIECSGQPGYQRLAIDVVARLGRVAFLAEPGDLLINVDRDLVQKGVSLHGHLDINRGDAGRLMRMIGEIPGELDTFITHRYSLSRIADAFEQQMRFECGKIVLYPWQ
jgi:L-iditol 2-dehydrogenase